MQSCCGPLIQKYLNMQSSKVRPTQSWRTTYVAGTTTEIVCQKLKCLSADRSCQHNSVTTVQNGNKLYWCVLKIKMNFDDFEDGFRKQKSWKGSIHLRSCNDVVMTAEYSLAGTSSVRVLQLV